MGQHSPQNNFENVNNVREVGKKIYSRANTEIAVHNKTKRLKNKASLYQMGF